MRAFGLKHTARRLAADNDVPLLPGSALLDTAEDALAAARAIGYPVMLKSTAGGGGIGMQLCRNEQALREAFEPVRRLSRNNFADDGVFIEKFVEHARHIEVQIFGDGRGDVIALGERDCSLQRRNQKVVEETPAPNLPTSVRDAMLATAERLARAVSYRSAGTVEYLYDADRAAFYFLEVNTRLQVEHGVTEEVLGVDLVEWMLRVAAGEPLDPAALRVQPRGHSIQVRLYAEDPGREFEPCTGVLTEVRFPDTARVETWVERGSEISPWYDPMIAKLIVHGDDRSAALAQLARALADTRLAGLETNLDYLRQIAADPVFAAGRQTTAYLATVDYRVDAIDVLAGGMQTTLQDWPGRVGYWDIGVPPSGPMDELSVSARQPLARQSGIRRRPRAHGDRPHVTIPQRRHRRAHGRADARRARRLGRSGLAADRRAPRPDLGARQDRRRGRASVPARARRLRRAAVSRQPRHLHARPVRRARWPAAAHRRRAASRSSSLRLSRQRSTRS